jgi:hypothetical protein
MLGMHRPRLPGSRYWLSYLYAGIGVLLLLGSFVMLYPLRHVEGFGTELRINIGANLFDLVLAVLVLQPLVLSLNRNAVRWRNRLDYRDVIRRIDRADDRVDIWKHWTGMLEPAHLEGFTAAVRADVGPDTRKSVLARYSAKYGPGRHAVLLRVTT